MYEPVLGLQSSAGQCTSVAGKTKQLFFFFLIILEEKDKVQDWPSLEFSCYTFCAVTFNVLSSVR